MKRNKALWTLLYKLNWIAWLDSEHDDSQWKFAGRRLLICECQRFCTDGLSHDWRLKWCQSSMMCLCLFLLDIIPRGDVWTSVYWIQFLEETQVGHTHLYMCVHANTRGHFFAQTYRCVHTPAVISVEAHERSLTTMRAHICASGTDRALWIWVALQDNNGRKKLSSRIKGITTKSTTAARINKTEQDLSPSRSEVQTVRQTDTNLLAFRSPTQFC